MGGTVSTGQDNDELVDNLLDSGYIRSKKVEQVFRAVDRADYIFSSYKHYAYRDFAWTQGNIRLSAPCVYSSVIEGLSLEPGLSFLNLGSGTGYLSTMAGLILSHHGTNHGIELHEDCLKYAYDKLEEFKQKSLALDEFDFCEPLFVQGNCLSVVPDRQYDRVYCGAACPESHEAFIKRYVRVGGILVMPFKNQLLRIQRVDETTWIQHAMLPVSFAPLIVPTPEENNLFHLPECDPLSLQELCRSKIRNYLRRNVWREHAELETKKLIPPRQRAILPTYPNHSTLERFVMPIFEESDESLSDDDEPFGGRTRLLLNVDANPGETITTTLQLVRAMIQPDHTEHRQNWQERNNQNEDRQSVSASVNLHEDSHEIRKQSNSSNKERCIAETEINNSAESSVDSVYEKSDEQPFIKNGKTEERSRSTESYFDISESDDEPEQENVFTQRKKIAKREKTDSGIVEDVNLTNDEGSSSSNTNHSDFENADNADSMVVDLADFTMNKYMEQMYREQMYKAYIEHPSSSSDNSLSEEMIYGHYVDAKAFSNYMKEKIHQLPLPFSLKLYINYNRQL